MIASLEAGIWDEQQLQNLIDELDYRPETILPHYIGLSTYVGFLCTKIRRPELARRILYATLTWELGSDRDTAEIELSISDIAQVERLLGRERSPEQIRAEALDRSYRNVRSAFRIVP